MRRGSQEAREGPGLESLSPDSVELKPEGHRSQERHQSSPEDTESQAKESSIARGELCFERLRNFGCLLSEIGILFQPKIHLTLKMPEVRELLLYQE